MISMFAENDSECQNPKNPILIRFGYYLFTNEIQQDIDERSFINFALVKLSGTATEEKVRERQREREA